MNQKSNVSCGFVRVWLIKVIVFLAIDSSKFPQLPLGKTLFEPFFFKWNFQKLPYACTYVYKYILIN